MKFTLQHKDPSSQARAGELQTDHGVVKTPIFMPVGTAATVKGIFHRDVRDEARAQIILANTYHLYLRPGMDILERAGGVHRFSTWPFASEKRVGDLTLGDFWGFHEEYPSYDEKQGLSNGKGVSCILVNTNQGKVALEQCESQFVLMTSDFEKVARHNDQLHSPSKYSPKREQILELYQKEGYEAVDRYFHKNYKKDILKYTVSGMLPKGLKRNIKKMAGKIKNK